MLLINMPQQLRSGLVRLQKHNFGLGARIHPRRNDLPRHGNKCGGVDDEEFVEAFGVEILVSSAWGREARGWGLGFEVLGFGFWVLSFGFWVLSLRFSRTIDFKQRERWRVQRVHSQSLDVHNDQHLRYFRSLPRPICVIETSERSSNFHAVKMGGKQRGGFVGGDEALGYCA